MITISLRQAICFKNTEHNSSDSTANNASDSTFCTVNLMMYTYMYRVYVQ